MLQHLLLCLYRNVYSHHHQTRSLSTYFPKSIHAFNATQRQHGESGTRASSTWTSHITTTQHGHTGSCFTAAQKKHMQSPAPVATSVLASIMFGAQRGPKTSICNSAVRHTHFIFLKACFSIYWKLLRCPEHNILPTCDRLGRYLFASCLLARLWVPRPCANKTQCRCAWMVCHFNVMMDNCIWQ